MSTPIDKSVSALAPDRSGAIVIGTDVGFFRLRGEGLSSLAPVEADRPETRTNDGKVDPAGRFLVGTIALDLAEGMGSLYALQPDLWVRRILSGLTVSNGLGWSPDGKAMYLIDSFKYGVDRYDYDVDDGAVGPPEQAVAIPEALGLADGMTVDADGCLWVAIFGGSAVHRYTPDGALDVRVELPVTHPTSCTFGGPQLSTLFITSARSTSTAP